MRHCWRLIPMSALLVLLPWPCAGSAQEVVCCEARVSEARPAPSQDINTCAACAEGPGMGLALKIGGEPLMRFPMGTSAAAQQGADPLREVLLETGRVLRDWVDGDSDDKPRLKGSPNADCCGSS